MADFVNALKLTFSGGNATNVVMCKESVNHYAFYQYSLIPAILLTLLFAMSKKRRNILRNKFYGRPALIYPMDSLTRQNRLCYGCAFGATAYLVYDIVFHNRYAIQYDGHRALKTLVGIASTFIYGLVYFPVLSGLAIDSVLSLGFGTLYVFFLMIAEFVKLTTCKVSWKFTLLNFFRMLPALGCFLYLLVYMPMRMKLAFKKRNYFYWHKDYSTETQDDIRTSYAGHHVASLFRKPPIKLKPPVTGIKDRLFVTAKDLFKRIIYKNKRGFRYPARIITVAFVSANVIYMVTFEFFAIVPRFLDNYLENLEFKIDSLRSVQVDNDNTTAFLIQLLEVIHRFFFILYYELVITTVLAAIFAIFNILNTMSSYRANLLALYRGDHSNIPPVSNTTSHCAYSIKYAGFQVGYIIWGFFIHLFVFELLSMVIAVLIVIIESDLNWFLIWFVQLIWPFAVSAIILVIGILLLSKFFFLQERGRYLALDNRSFYFNFTYFMFFYNIFLGIASCLMRILKAMFLGLIFLSRLDSSTLPRRFEFLDPGFKAYVGYMHMEAAHNHPVMVVFCRLMLLGLQEKRDRQESKIIVDDLGLDCGSSVNNISIEIESREAEQSEAERRRKMAARFHWHVTYTLLHNPDIRIMRRGHLHVLQQARRLGVSIPVSDRQAYIEFDRLQLGIAKAKERLEQQ